MWLVQTLHVDFSHAHSACVFSHVISNNSLILTCFFSLLHDSFSFTCDFFTHEFIFTDDFYVTHLFILVILCMILFSHMIHILYYSHDSFIFTCPMQFMWLYFFPWLFSLPVGSFINFPYYYHSFCWPDFIIHQWTHLM